jgi:Flp pilus assembly protein TadD
MMRVLQHQLELVPEDVRARVLLSSHHAVFGDEAASMRELQIATALRPNDSNILYNAACTYGIFGRKSEALETLRKAIAAGYHNYTWIARDSDLACLHDDPEFIRIIEEGRSRGW